MPRLFRICSVVAHTIVVAWFVVADLLAVGPLPIPHSPLTFVGAIPIKLIDIPAPPVAHKTSAPPSDASAFVAPIEAPTGITQEPERVPMPRIGVGLVDGPGGIGIEPLALPPPPPPPPTPPPPPMRLSSGMRPPLKVVNVDPVYPRVAQDAHVGGVVILETTIDTRGRVIDVRVLRSVPLLDQAAADAVRQWIYTPTLLNGVPVPILMTVTVNFKLQER